MFDQQLFFKFQILRKPYLCSRNQYFLVFLSKIKQITNYNSQKDREVHNFGYRQRLKLHNNDTLGEIARITIRFTKGLQYRERLYNSCKITFTHMRYKTGKPCFRWIDGSSYYEIYRRFLESLSSFFKLFQSIAPLYLKLFLRKFVFGFGSARSIITFLRS